MKYVEINIRGYNKIYTVSDVEVEQKINAFAEEDRSSVRYLFVVTNKGETLKIYHDGKRTMKVLPEYLENEVSGEIIEVKDSFTSRVYPNKVLHYL